MAREEKLLSFLKDTKSYPHTVDSVTHIETHISDIFLTGEYAYKLKKPIRLDFLDFSSVEDRHEMLERELVLNSRYSSGLYIAVIPIYEHESQLTFTPYKEPVEYLLKMKQFDSNALFSTLLKEDKLSEDLLFEVTHEIAKLHTSAARTPAFWSYEIASRIILENTSFLQNAGFNPGTVHKALLTELQNKRQLITKRQNTHVRSLHGDLHLRNICIFQGKATLFDGIEFNDTYSCIDTMADFGFFVMDLVANKRPDLAAVSLNRYLELTDDFEGLLLLPLYVAYRALVRAKVAAVEIMEGHSEKEFEVRHYLSLAQQYLLQKNTFLIAVGGTSGSGKSNLSGNLSRTLGCITVRSDAVRKHILGIAPYTAAPESAYDDITNERTYAGLLERARIILQAGFGAVIDAVCISLKKRLAIEALALSFPAPFVGLWCTVDAAIARERIQQRANDISDADSSVLEKQLLQKPKDLLWHSIDTSESPEETLKKALKFIPWLSS